MGLSKEQLRERTLAELAAGLIPTPKGEPRTVTISVPVVGNCPYRGAIIEFCPSCKGEWKHVRDCGHPENPTEKCTLIPVSDTTWNCQSCKKNPELPK